MNPTTRETIKISEGGVKLSLSTLPEQKELLKRIGDGNVSEGFRRVLGAFENAVFTAKVEDEMGSNALITAYNSIFRPYVGKLDADRDG